MINLSERERIFVIGGGLAIVLVAVWLGILAPYREAVAAAESKIASRERQLNEVQRLRQEYQRLQGELAEAERQLVGKGRGFSLFSFIEDVTTRTGVRDKLVSMRPQSTATQGEYREESVEIRLEKLRLDQLVRLLHAMEAADVVLNTKTLRIKPRFDDRSQLDTVIAVSFFQKSS